MLLYFFLNLYSCSGLFKYIFWNKYKLLKYEGLIDIDWYFIKNLYVILDCGCYVTMYICLWSYDVMYHVCLDSNE